MSSLSASGSLRTDSLGEFTAHVGFYSGATLDSIAVAVEGGDCWGFTRREIRERHLAVIPGTSDTVANITVMLQRSAAPGRLTLGPVCAAMVGPLPSESENRVTLRIDEIGDSIRGRWDINYDESVGDDYGRFSGAREGSTLVLDLRHDEPWGACTGYWMKIPLEAGDTLGIGSYGSEGCPHTSVPLRFVEGAARGWPFD